VNTPDWFQSMAPSSQVHRARAQSDPITSDARWNLWALKTKTGASRAALVIRQAAAGHHTRRPARHAASPITQGMSSAAI
jgi:hypothetical protein